MYDNDKKAKELDDFWDLASLVPKKQYISREPQTVKTSEVTVSGQKAKISSESSTVIKRYIDPLHKEHKILQKESFEHTESYVPDSSLLHKVTLKKRKCAYDLYTDFLKLAVQYNKTTANESPYATYYSYVPQYDQLSPDQLKYYLWWRECFRRGELIRTDLSYVLLYIYELINLGDTLDVTSSLELLVRLWNTYHKEFSAISGKLAVWICDFCLLHKLSAPTAINPSVMKYVPSLKEFYINIPRGDINTCARSLLKYGTEYDYHTSKFATERNIDIFDRHVMGAMICAVRYFSRDGVVLSELTSEDSRLIRNAFEGALCASRWRYEIEVKYCSFSRSNELRFIMGDIVKYSENKIRAFLGIKSRLSVYSIGGDLQKALDAYFNDAFASEKPLVIKKKEEKQEYDVLYETPKMPLSLENAKKIESDSWSTTNDLVSAFEKTENEPAGIVEILPVADTAPEEKPSGEFGERLGKYLDFALAIKSNDKNKATSFCKAIDMLPEAVVDAINEISVDIIGDILIEDSGDGFMIVECYENLI